MTLKVILQPGEDSGFIANVPALRGCWTQGRTRNETLENIREAIAAWIETEQDKIETDRGLQADIELVTI